MILAVVSVAAIWLVWFLHFRSRRKQRGDFSGLLMSLEIATVLLVALTGHVGGFLSGVNGPG